MRRVVVVGAGVVGLFCAVRLRQGGAQVTVLESEGESPTPFGPTASAAAAGMLAPFSTEDSPHAPLALASFDMWRSAQKGAEWADGVRFDGAVVIGRDEEEAQRLVQIAQRVGRQASALSHSQLRKRLPFEARISHAVFVADEGVADPVRVLTGLAMQARALGVLVEHNVEVMSATATSVLTHADRVHEADAVVLAPGAWARQKFVAAAPALGLLRPGKGQLDCVALPGRLAPILRAPDFYLAQRRDDVVLGSTLEMDRHDRRADGARSAELLAAAQALLPGEIRPLGAAWAGIRPMSPDGWPLVGPSGDGLLVAAGHSRNGWLLAPITAEIISAYVFGHTIAPQWEALSPQRFV